MRFFEQRALGLAAAGLLLAGACGDGEAVESRRVPRATVEQGSLQIVVREAGEVSAHRQTMIKNEVEGRRNTLIYLIPEGTVVEKGEKIAEIDASELIDRRADQEIKVERARAQLVEAKKNLEIQLKEIEAAEEEAKSELRIAELAWEKFIGRHDATVARADGDVGGTNGEMLVELRTLVTVTQYEGLVVQVAEDLLGDEGDATREMGEMAQLVLKQIDRVRLARARLKLLEDTLEHSRKLYAKDYITKNDLDRDDLNYASQLSQAYLAMNELDLLISYTLKKDQIRLRQDVRNARLELEKVEVSNRARRAREEAEYKSVEAEFGLAKERLDNLANQIDKAVIHAPTPGLVLHARIGRWSDIVEEGSELHERQNILMLPDFSTFVAEVKIQETDINRVAVGQKATVLVDAFPDKLYHGEVTRVAPIPDSGERWMNQDLRVYKTAVQIDGTHKELRPGMSATVDISAGTMKDVLTLPIEAVLVQGEVSYVWKDVGGRAEASRVELGPASRDRVVVTAGLAAGDKVLLEVPAGLAAPEFEQPDQIKPAPLEAVGRKAERSQPADANADVGRDERRQLMEQIRDALAKKFPARAEELKDSRGWFRLMREPEIRSALEEDPEISALWEKMRSSMGGMRGPGGMGGDRRGSGGEGGARFGEGGGRGRGGDR